jgi:hypothetical protein
VLQAATAMLATMAAKTKMLRIRCSPGVFACGEPGNT